MTDKKRTAWCLVSFFLQRNSLSGRHPRRISNDCRTVHVSKKWCQEGGGSSILKRGHEIKKRKMGEEGPNRPSLWACCLSCHVDVLPIDFHTYQNCIKWLLPGTQQVGKCVSPLAYHYLGESQNLWKKKGKQIWGWKLKSFCHCERINEYVKVHLNTLEFRKEKK